MHGHGLRSHAKFRLDRYIFRPLTAKQYFLPFCWLRHFVVSPVGGSLRKLNTGAQLQTFPYPTASKTFVDSSDFMAKSNQEHKFRRSEATNGQTDKHTNKILNVFGRPGGGWSPCPTKFGMVVEDLEHVLVPSKQSELRHILLPLGGVENMGKPDPST